MDATQWGTRFHQAVITTVLMTFMIAGCGNQNSGSVNSVTLNGQNCVNQVKKDSFLVKWKNSVPAAYKNKRLGPNSLITRFDSITKEQVEKQILRKHLDEYEVAEHEFYVVHLDAEDMMSGVVTASTTAWGPADIQTQDAWSFLNNKRGDGVIVAVVDSGADINHPLLSNKIWVNTGETGLDAQGHDKSTNGIDDDHDGFIDDVNGFNFNGNNNDVSDLANHGTHVSGIIAGTASSNSFTGIAPNATIMPLKFIDGSGSGSVGDAISGMDFAVAHGAKVINASWGGDQCSSLLKQDIVDTSNAGVIFIAAAGNSGLDINLYPEWPAAFQVPGKLTIASYNYGQMLSKFSNYGILVDVAAPGETILSTIPGTPEGQMGTKSGTSMATPFVSGLAALLLSAKPTATPLDIANAINNSVIQGSGFGVRTHGKINALSAAQYLMSH